MLIGFALQKNLYRAGILSCPTTCSADTRSTDCKCVCPDIASYINSTDARMGVLDVIFAGEDIYFWNKVGVICQDGLTSFSVSMIRSNSYIASHRMA